MAFLPCVDVIIVRVCLCRSCRVTREIPTFIASLTGAESSSLQVGLTMTEKGVELVINCTFEWRRVISERVSW